MDSYLTSIPDAVRETNRDVFSKLIEDNCSLVQDLISWLVQPSLDFIRHGCRLFVTTSALHRVSSLLQLYTCLLDTFIDGMESVPQTQTQLWLPCLFLFSLVWSLGGALVGDSRTKFDAFYRTLISGTDQKHPRPKSIKMAKVHLIPICVYLCDYHICLQNHLFPERDTVFDYFFQKTGGIWALWDDLLDRNATIPAGAKVSELIIPTVDTARQTYFLDTLTKHGVPLLLVGPTGTGKSAINNSYLVKLPRDR